MKQKKLVIEMYRACVNHDEEKQKKLYKEEFIKIFKRRALGKSFSSKWTIIR